MDLTTFRLLPFNEWPLLQRPLEAARIDTPLPKPEQGIIIVAEDQGRMVGCVGAERAWNVNPLWLDRDYRGNGLAQRLAEAIKMHNTENLTEFLVTTNPHVDRLVHRLGFIPLEGQLWRRG